MRKKIISIGWDVGGWMGDNHGFAISSGDLTEGTLSWLGEPTELGIPPGSIFSLDEIISEVVEKESVGLERDRVTLGIDAPLGFPEGFADLLCRNRHDFTRPEKEIYNELAYRETDRFIYEEFDKKPLSAVFDRLGTNCTAALVHVRRWINQYGFIHQPSDEAGQNNIYEVYPALVKKRGSSTARPEFAELLPKNITPGTDAYDAALCSIMALGAESGGTIPEVPELVGPSEINERIREEGWIYHPPLD